MEDTIRSVFNQGYPSLEYIVIDGGSSDESPEIIRRYSRQLAFWAVEKDRGQSDALNRGFTRATGDIMGWINSDDLLAPGALAALAAAYRPGLHWYYGHCGAIWADGSRSIPDCATPPHAWTYEEFLFRGAVIPQPAVFWNRELWEAAGGYVLDHPLVMDYELWLRFSRLAPMTPINAWLGTYREHAAAKTGTTQGRRRYARAKQAVRWREFSRVTGEAIRKGHYQQAAGYQWKALGALWASLRWRLSPQGKR